jgi:hypothetical protein
MIGPEILHEKTGNIYVSDKPLDHEELLRFQESENPEDIGFIFVRKNVLLYRFLYRKANRVYDSLRPLDEAEKNELQNFTQEQLDKDFYFSHTLLEEEVPLYFIEYQYFNNVSPDAT